MGKTTRREFIKKSGLTLAAVGVSGRAFCQHVSLAANSALTQAAALSTNDKMLVVIQLAGGNDGINNIIPLSGQNAALYRQFRPTLAVPAAQIIPIGADAGGNQLGLHPSFQPLHNLFLQGRMGIIQSVGYPNPNRSHFRSMDIWHVANPERIDGTGWLGDYLDVSFPSNDNPLIGVSIGGRLPLSLRAKEVPVPAINSIEQYVLQATPEQDAANRVEAFLALNREAAPERVLYEQIRQTALDAHESVETLQAGVSQYTPDPNIVYSANNPLARAMQQVAQIIAGDLGTKILYVTLGGFDTHQNQATPHTTLLGRIADAVETFYRDMQRLGKDDKVLIMSWSEFGRKLPENGNFGTDHGASAPQYVFGTSVKGGIYGEHPDLTDLSNVADTKFTIDFRSLYATILEQWLEVDSHEVLGESFAPLDFIQ